MGLGCPDSIPISAQAFHASDATSWRVAKQYGTYTSGNVPIWGPREGEKFLFVSTGSIGAPNGAGVLTKSSGGFQEGKDNGNPDGQPLPGPIRAEYGSNSGAGGTPFIDCDAAGDCSDSLLQQWEIGDEEANDLLWFEFDITVPAGVHGYQFDFAWFSTEYPEWVSPEPYNDIAVWWASGETFTGNVTFVDDQPLTVTALAQAIHDQGFWGADPQLAGTGFDGVLQNSFPFSSACFPQDPFNDAQCPIGGGTGWYTASASAMPGETITMAFAIFDMGDSIYDTAMLLDNFQWDCEGCDPTLQECGVVPTPAG
jgi:hypothetical protein